MTHTSCRFLRPTLALLLAAILAGALRAASAPSTPPPSTTAPKPPAAAGDGLVQLSPHSPQSGVVKPAASDETVTLNPFVVSESDHVGYAATSTLAGTRINTALRDVGAAISIITPEFLLDTASTNLGELLALTTATEVGGAFGNFAGGATDGGRPDQSESRENPSANNRVRGIGAATTTRDYFVTDIPFDAYNSSGVTIARGPNSLLFGIGNPAGIIEGSVIKPLLARNRTTIGGRFGSGESYRATLDLNRVLVPGRLAFRLATVNEHNNFEQKPAFDRKRRGYGALEFVVREGTHSFWVGRTAVRFSGELGDSQSNPVNVIPPVNAMYLWTTAGLRPKVRATVRSGTPCLLPAQIAALSCSLNGLRIRPPLVSSQHELDQVLHRPVEAAAPTVLTVPRGLVRHGRVRQQSDRHHDDGDTRH